MAGYRTPIASEEVTKSEGKDKEGCNERRHIKNISNEPQNSFTLPLAH